MTEQERVQRMSDLNIEIAQTTHDMHRAYEDFRRIKIHLEELKVQYARLVEEERQLTLADYEEISI